MDKLEIATIIAYIAFILGIPLGIVESYRVIAVVYMAITGVCFVVLGIKFWLKKRN